MHSSPLYIKLLEKSSKLPGQPNISFRREINLSASLTGSSLRIKDSGSVFDVDIPTTAVRELVKGWPCEF